MNTDNNRRFQETENLICQAYGRLSVKKELKHITVSDVCREAGIHRTTFYGHFQDVVELETRIVREQFYQFYLGYYDREGRWNFRDGLLAQVRYIYTYRNIVKRHLNYETCDVALEEYLNKEVITQNMSAYKKAFHCETDEEVWYHQEFYYLGMMAIIRRWVMNDCPEPAEQIADMIMRFCGMEDRFEK